MKALEHRIELLAKLGQYLSSKNEKLEEAINMAYRQNAWFTEDYVRQSLKNITEFYLDKSLLTNWLANYPTIVNSEIQPKLVGIVMAGNIPLVGFHDFLCAYVSGHQLKLKLSSKDTVLWQHIFEKMTVWDADFCQQVQTSEMLKGCDVYIATGSNNSARYFEYYFQKYPHIIRKNRSSVAILDGSESEKDLENLSDDVNLYFGLGCRNVTQIFVPEDYNFEPLLAAFNKYIGHIDHNKFKNNYDYQLALFLLNKQYYMSNGHLLLVLSESVYAAISVLHYQNYSDKDALVASLATNDSIQCISISNPKAYNNQQNKFVKFGDNQKPALNDYADGVDTMDFLANL